MYKTSIGFSPSMTKTHALCCVQATVGQNYQESRRKYLLIRLLICLLQPACLLTPSLVGKAIYSVFFPILDQSAGTWMAHVGLVTFCYLVYFHFPV